MNNDEYNDNQNEGLKGYKIEDLIQNLAYTKEPVKTGELDKDGKSIHALHEILSNFGKGVKTKDVLESLRKYDKTFLLFQKMLFFAFKEIEKTNKSFSINMFLKDLSNPGLRDEISKNESEFDINSSKLIFEVLEYDYGKLDTNAINNLIFLNEKGYKITIDDFSLEPGKENLSLENLIILFKNGIIIDYVKIDGKYLKKIFNGDISEEQIYELSNVIKFLKNKNIKIIGERIGNTEEGYMAKKLSIDLFQGKYLTNEFSLLDSERKKVDSKVNQIINPALIINNHILKTKKTEYNFLHSEIIYLIDLFSNSINQIHMYGR